MYCSNFAVTINELTEIIPFTINKQTDFHSDSFMKQQYINRFAALSQLGHNISEPTCFMLLLLNVASKQQTSIPYICLCKDLGSNPRVTEHEAHAMKKI
jgi:hypothetical protein